MNEKPSVNAPSNFLVMYRNIMIANLLVLLRNLVLTSFPTLCPSVQQRPHLVMVARCVRYKPSDPPPNAPYDIFFVPQRIPRISKRRENKNQDLFSSRNSLLLPPSLLMCVVCIKGKIHIHGEILTSLAQILPFYPLPLESAAIAAHLQ